jgi:uncharacterized protein YaiI (UPF0178 family)
VQIWVDADACPVVIKDILFRAAERTQTLLTLVANQAIRVPASEFIKTVQVPAGFDVADNEIVREHWRTSQHARFYGHHAQQRC